MSTIHPFHSHYHQRHYRHRQQHPHGRLSKLPPNDNKRALLIGINYRGNKKLQGCIEDTYKIKKLLIQEYLYYEDMIRVLTDDDNSPREDQPTLENIVQAWRSLFTCPKTRKIFFYFSGHGKKETLITSDFKELGSVFFIQFLKKNARPDMYLTFWIDMCHAGTFGLPFQINNWKVVRNNYETIPCSVQLISSSRVDEKSYTISEKGSLLTFRLIKILKRRGYYPSLFQIYGDLSQQAVIALANKNQNMIFTP